MAFTEVLAIEVIKRIESLQVSDITKEKYASMKYPRWLPLMRFTTKAFRMKDFGSIMMMQTIAMGGKMNLLTISFMPFTGKAVPYLLIDCMSMRQKSIAYVEYYDCTGISFHSDRILEIKEKYARVPDYNEKEAWYVGERMNGSLIKGGESADEDELLSMVLESIDSYLELIDGAAIDSACLLGLLKFRRKMIDNGNPSTGTMTKVLGKKGADVFFKEYVMPIEG